MAAAGRPGRIAPAIHAFDDTAMRCGYSEPSDTDTLSRSLTGAPPFPALKLGIGE
jgi:hypothetical protein